MKTAVHRWSVIALVAVIVTCMAFSVRAEDDKKGPAKKPYARLAGPYAKLKLDADQRAKVLEIQAQTKEKIKALYAAEREAILPLLKDDQKAELAKLEAERDEKMNKGDEKMNKGDDKKKKGDE